MEIVWSEHNHRVLLGDLIDLEGWFEFNGTFTLDTLYYAKYTNRGSGASEKGRVKWPCCYVVTNATEIQSFTVESFIH
ncbi:hypothetical protein WN944_003980 [Citrus x changshan-huyou]|uniref:Pectinesterase catalytic domain-containing protein n=1 Tax=Citrus x changshan-huyou TaxID=2935761 RepID=A0AAP0M099_9ROSI